MGNIVASYGGKLEKKAQFNYDPEKAIEEASGDIIPAERQSVGEVLEDIDLGDPGTIASRFEEGQGEDFGAVRGEHASLPLPKPKLPKPKLLDDETNGRLGEAPELAYKGLMSPSTPMPEDTETVMPDEEDFIVRDFPEEAVEIDYNSDDPLGNSSRKTPATGGLAPEDEYENVETDLDWGADILESSQPGFGPLRSSLILDKIEKIAAYLGEKGDIRSELIAGDLLMSVIKNIDKLNK